MSLCDRCPAPGACCQVMNLTMSDGEPPTVWEGDDPNAELVRRNADLHTFVGRQRIETFTVPDDDPEDAGRQYSTWLWSCTALNAATGRCDRWGTRPALCARYEPASGDGLCVFSQPLENGEESAL